MAQRAGVAQLVEHRFCKPAVAGSSPIASSILATAFPFFTQNSHTGLLCPAHQFDAHSVTALAARRPRPLPPSARNCCGGERKIGDQKVNGSCFSPPCLALAVPANSFEVFGVLVCAGRGIVIIPRARVSSMERYRSGQTGQTVNLLAYAFEGSNPSLSTTFGPMCRFLFK